MTNDSLILHIAKCERLVRNKCVRAENDIYKNVRKMCINTFTYQIYLYIYIHVMYMYIRKKSKFLPEIH